MTKEYTSNSHKSKREDQEEKKKIEPVVKGKVSRKKKTGARKFADVFISEDIENVKSYIFGEVLVPAIKKAISDVVTNGIDMILYSGTGGPNRDRRRSSTTSRVSYSGYYERDFDRGRSRDSQRKSTRTGYSFDDIVLDSRGEAEDVLSRMDELIDTYGVVSVADFYDLVGITGNYTDNKYGWTDIRNANVVRLRDGYMIKLPRAVAID